jgi:hypothetical protein
MIYMTNSEINDLVDSIWTNVDVHPHFESNRLPFDIAQSILDEATRTSPNRFDEVLTDSDWDNLLEALEEAVWAGLT